MNVSFKYRSVWVMTTILFTSLIILNQEAPAAPKIPIQKGKVYRHVTGLTFWYPDNWRVKELDEALQLIPNDVEIQSQGPDELYVIAGESVAGTGILNPDDPRVIHYTDQVVQSILPSLMRVGRVKYVDMITGKGVFLQWEGKNNKGKTVCAEAFITIRQNFAISLSAIAYKHLLEKRNDELHRIFASFAFGEGQRDPDLIGHWELTATQSITNQSVWETDWSRAQLVSDNQSHLVFTPDGKWSRTDTSHMIAGAGDVWIESSDKDESGGRWYAGEGTLFMIWENNTWEDYSYKIYTSAQGRELRMICGKTGQVWNESN
jgi:hypothetical protein